MTSPADERLARAAHVHASLSELDATVAVAESLTGGLLCAALTETPGASTTMRGGLVVYATDLKRTLAGVSAHLLTERGAVDPDVALALARGARTRLAATFGVGVTGVAGPDPQDGKPVGTVFAAVSGPHTEASLATVVRRQPGRDPGRVGAGVPGIAQLGMRSVAGSLRSLRADGKWSAARRRAWPGNVACTVAASPLPSVPRQGVIPMQVLRQVVGETLRGLRLRQRRTLREVSASARVSLGYLSEVERGQKEPSSELLAAICGALEVELSDVFWEVSTTLRREEKLAGGRIAAMPGAGSARISVAPGGEVVGPQVRALPTVAA
jgi:PncC family amidohydrolase